MHNKLMIIGASGHGKVVADIALKTDKYREIEFLDDNEEARECIGFKVVGRSSEIEKYVGMADFIVAIGNAKIRKRITDQLLGLGATMATLIHPAAVISRGVTIGEGSVVMAGAIVHPDSTIGNGCIINTCASVDHDCRLGDYVHIAVGAHVCGTVELGEATWIGAGAVVKNNVNICGSCMIGVGAAVVTDIKEAGIYVGVPARRMK